MRASPSILTGTWQGTVTGDDQAAGVTATFSADGYYLYEYTNNRGEVRAVELSAPGQFQFVPQGGGVTTVSVQSVDKRPGGISYVVRIGTERSSGSGYIEQQYLSEQHDYALTNEGLRVRVVHQAAAYVGDRGGSAGGPQNAKLFEGVLKKMN